MSNAFTPNRRAASLGGVTLAAFMVLITGCGTTRSADAPARAQESTPRFNLSGYSDAFKQGYADACSTPRRRNVERIKTDYDYSAGWNDGQSVCRSR